MKNNNIKASKRFFLQTKKWYPPKKPGIKPRHCGRPWRKTPSQHV
jgi:hypothetical protein